MKKVFNKIKQKCKDLINWKYFPILIIFLFSVLSVYPTFFKKYHTGDDFWFHYASIKTYADYLPGSIFAKIFPDMSYNFGYGMGFFYPALPHIVGAIIYKIVSIFGKGIIVTSVILQLLTFFFIGLSMYVLGCKIFNDKKKGLIASLFYMTYNYVYVDVIFRGAINETFVFIFIPLIFLGIWYLLKENNKKMFYIFFTLGYIGLMYSHLVMAVWFTIFLIVFLLFFIKDVFKRENLMAFIIASIIILIFTSTFTIPMIEHKLFGSYVAFSEDRTMTMSNIWYMPIQGYIKPYIYATCTNGGFIYTQFNYIVIVFFIAALYKLFINKIPTERKKYMVALLIFGLVSLIFETIPYIWFHMPETLLSIQFIWRLSTFIGFTVCLFAAEGLDLYLELFKKKYIKIALIIVICCLMIFVKQNINKTNSTIPAITSDFNYYNITRESYPTNTYSNLEYLQNRNHKVLVKKGEANIKVLSNNVPDMKFKVTNIKNNATLELPRLYYLGYKITDSKGNEIKYTEDKYGFISIKVNKNDTYTVKYVGTNAYKIAFITKGVMCILILIYLGRQYLIKIKK